MRIFNRIPSLARLTRINPDVRRQILFKLEKRPDFLALDMSRLYARPALRREDTDRRTFLLTLWTLLVFFVGGGFGLLLCVL